LFFLSFFLSFLPSFFLSFREGRRGGSGRGRRRERESQADYVLSAEPDVELSVGLDLLTLRSQPEVISRV